MERFFFCSERFSSWSRWSMNFFLLSVLTLVAGLTSSSFFRFSGVCALLQERVWFFSLSLRLLLHLFLSFFFFFSLSSLSLLVAF